jgi:hypothetical protein
MLRRRQFLAVRLESGLALGSPCSPSFEDYFISQAVRALMMWTDLDGPKEPDQPT